jgi:hypothetical protein
MGNRLVTERLLRNDIALIRGRPVAALIESGGETETCAAPLPAGALRSLFGFEYGRSTGMRQGSRLDFDSRSNRGVLTGVIRVRISEIPHDPGGPDPSYSPVEADASPPRGTR